MTSAKFLITTLIGVIFTLLILLSFPPIYAKYVSQDMATKSAYSVTEKIISAVNMISSSDEYTKMEVPISCKECDVSFFGDKRYVKSTAIYRPRLFLASDKVKSSFGLFTLEEFHAPKKIITCTDCTKNLTIMKNATGIYIFEEGWKSGECGGLGENCCDDKCEEGLYCNKTKNICLQCNRYCPPTKCGGGWLNYFCDKDGCITPQECISETDSIPTCTYKVIGWFGCTKEICKPKCYVDCEKCPSS